MQPSGSPVEREQVRAMRGAARWWLLAIAVALLAIGYVGVSGVLGTSQAGSAGSPPSAVTGQVTGPEAMQRVPAPGPGEKKVVLEQLGMV